MSTNCDKDTPPHLVYEIELAIALKNLPEIPPIEVLLLLRESARMSPRISKLKEIGLSLQREHGTESVPPVSELECAAGLWAVIRDNLMIFMESKYPDDTPKANSKKDKS